LFLIKINLFFETLLLNYENKTKILHYQSLTMTCKIFGRDSLNNKDPFFCNKSCILFMSVNKQSEHHELFIANKIQID